MSLQYTVSRHSVGSHCTPGGVTPPLGTNDRGVIQPGESLNPLTPNFAHLILSSQRRIGEIKLLCISDRYSVLAQQIEIGAPSNFTLGALTIATNIDDEPSQ